MTCGENWVSTTTCAIAAKPTGSHGASHGSLRRKISLMRMRRSGRQTVLCPEMSTTSKEVSISEGFETTGHDDE